MATVIGKPCVKCGSTERYAYGGCVPCNREKVAKWRKAGNSTKEASDKKNARKHREVEAMADSYIAYRLRMSVKDCPPELIEAKRQQLLIHRAVKQLQSTLKEKEKQ